MSRALRRSYADRPTKHKCSGAIRVTDRPRDDSGGGGGGGNQPAIEHERRRLDAISRDSIVAAFPVDCRASLGFIERD